MKTKTGAAEDVQVGCMSLDLGNAIGIAFRVGAFSWSCRLSTEKARELHAELGGQLASLPPGRVSSPINANKRQ